MVAFHSYLIQYINIACFSKADYVHSLVNVSTLFRKKASHVISLKRRGSIIYKSINLSSSKINVKTYQGTNKFVLEMMDKLELELKPDLFGAYVHGSLATNEEITYSDFDALLILKDAVFENKERLSSVALKLHHLQQIMHEFDPLQHHGWFVMTESMLQDYPSMYFPPELFEHSRSLLNGQGLSFSVHPKEVSTRDYQTPFYQLSNGVLNKLKSGFQASNSFDLKSLLSEFMLLPALYIQAKSKHGIYKKDSFSLAAKDFKKEDWEIMNQVSFIREEWNYQISSVQKYLLCSKNYTIRKIGRKYAPKIASSISKELTANFYERMTYLTQQMQHKLKDQNPLN